MQNLNFTAIDFETANSKRSSACAIGIMVVKNGKIVKEITKLIKPTPDYFDYYNVQVHGITEDMVENEPDFSEIWEEIKPYFENQNVIAHNAGFDIGVLKATLDSYGILHPKLNYFCTVQMSKKVIPGFMNYKLPTVSNYFGIDLNHHDAGSDAKAAALIAVNLCKLQGVSTLETLASSIEYKIKKV